MRQRSTDGQTAMPAGPATGAYPRESEAPASGRRSALFWVVRAICWLMAPRQRPQPARNVRWHEVAVISLLLAGTWIAARLTAPVPVKGPPIVRTITVPDHAALAQRDAEIARLKAALDAALSRAEQAEAELAAARKQIEGLEAGLAAAKAEIARLQAELAAKPRVIVPVEEFNARCPRCGRLFYVGSMLLERGESIRCPNMRCHIILSARSAVANRTYTQNRQQ